MRRFLVCLSLVVIALASAALSAQAQTAPKREPAMPKPLIEHRVRGAQVFYLGNFNGLEGWMMIRAGQPEFYYATPDNQALVMGFLFDGEGTLQTADQLQNLNRTREAGMVDMMASQLPDEIKGDIRTLPDAEAPAGAAPADAVPVNPTPDAARPVPGAIPGAQPEAPAAQNTAPAATAPANPQAATTQGAPQVANEIIPNTPANRLYSDFQNATSLLWGKAEAPAFYAIIDLNCPHCQQFLREVEGAVTAGQVSVRIILVGIDQRSMRQSAFMLAAGDGVERLIRYAKGDEEAVPAPEGLNLQAVRANNQILGTWNLRATPIIVYKAAKSGEIRLIRGRPLNIDDAVGDLTGR